MQGRILAPAAILVLWTLVMLVWLAATRLPAINRMGGLGSAKPGGRGQDLEGVLPDTINWKSHNYAHLVEQPVLFYATSASLAILGFTSADVVLAWSYVCLRILHSLWQALINTVPVRFTIFGLSTLCLIVLAVRVAITALTAG